MTHAYDPAATRESLIAAVRQFRAAIDTLCSLDTVDAIVSDRQGASPSWQAWHKGRLHDQVMRISGELAVLVHRLETLTGGPVW